ncbi:hypothetical protein BPAE_0143g00260 [Botrytis paeoniae]|uniref:Uncharacterized protein n=1 Tax=Botrytis paeoniae TaxID=278948 RepID=A0A4Z1FIJ7_9HELO|nr:hypothetical protein BPAE_0143g00260 [Botrytis paeoniae]
MSGDRRPFKLFSSRRDSNDDLTCPPPHHSTASTSSQTGGAKPIFDFSNMNTSMVTGSSKSSTPSVPKKKFQDAPKTEWTNEDCREWLEDYLLTMCGYKEVVAVKNASNFYEIIDENSHAEVPVDPDNFIELKKEEAFKRKDRLKTRHKFGLDLAWDF